MVIYLLYGSRNNYLWELVSISYLLRDKQEHSTILNPEVQAYIKINKHKKRQ